MTANGEMSNPLAEKCVTMALDKNKIAKAIVEGTKFNIP